MSAGAREEPKDRDSGQTSPVGGSPSWLSMGGLVSLRGFDSALMNDPDSRGEKRAEVGSQFPKVVVGLGWTLGEVAKSSEYPFSPARCTQDTILAVDRPVGAKLFASNSIALFGPEAIPAQHLAFDVVNGHIVGIEFTPHLKVLDRDEADSLVRDLGERLTERMWYRYSESPKQIDPVGRTSVAEWSPDGNRDGDWVQMFLKPVEVRRFLGTRRGFIVVIALSNIRLHREQLKIQQEFATADRV